MRKYICNIFKYQSPDGAKVLQVIKYTIFYKLI